MESSDKNILGVRLKLARKMAGMSLQELSDSLDNLVSKQSLSKYEQGSMKPSSSVLQAISRILKVKPDYFLKRSTIEIEGVSFRKKANLSKRIEDSVIEKARHYIERFQEIENILGRSIEFDNPLSEVVISSDSDVIEAAEMLRRYWDLGSYPIPNLVEMLELKGVIVILIDEEDAVDGVSFYTSQRIPVVIINSRDKSIERIRFTIIHELAHLLLQFSSNVLINSRLVEKLCHKFASCVLVPDSKIIEMIGGSHRSYIHIKELINVKEYFGISIRATVYKLKEMRIISETYYKRWMIFMSKTYGSKNEPGKYAGEEKNKLFNQLVLRALSEDLISISKAATLLDVSINDFRKGLISVE